MDPLTNLQVAVKNNVDVFYFSCTVPYNVLFSEDGQMGESYPGHCDLVEHYLLFENLGQVVRRPTSANLGLNF